MTGRKWILLVVALMFVCAAEVAASEPVSPYESANWSTPANIVDAQVVAALGKQGLQLRKPCSDAVFIRRVYLDMIGTVPTAKEVNDFLKDTSPNKRSVLIESLFSRDEFAEYWTMKWCDVLRVKSEFPMNLWPNAVQAYHRWVYGAIRDNRPYDQFAHELLTSSGSNFRVAPVNFYRAVQGHDPASIAKVVALTFMGTRFERWPQDRRDGMAAFFSKVAYKKTDEWKEEIVYLNPESTKPVKAVYPDGSVANIAGDADPRQVFADWLIAPSNKWFARSAVNRIWAWTMGHGIVDEPDDIRPDNPPGSPGLLNTLEKELIKTHYDLRQIYRLIFNSRTYQQSSIPQGDDGKAEFARYTVRQLDAEVLIDALDWIGGEGESYSSPIPEPFTFVPRENRTIALADGSITSSFLTIFGRPSRDTGLMSERGNQPTDTQRLYMLNSSDVQRRIEQSPKLQVAFNAAWRNPNAAISGIYMIILSRYPTESELSAAKDYLQKSQQRKQAAVDLAWALINSKEFLYRH